MAINTAALRGEVYAKYGTASALSSRVQWNKNKIGNIIKGAYVPDINECATLADALGLTQERFCEIFLPELSPYGETPPGHDGSPAA